MVDKPWIDCKIVGLCHAHGKCEQFHSEIKTDIDLERRPSGKFETNKLVLELTILAYNILRMIGQESIGRRGQPQSTKSGKGGFARSLATWS